MYTIKNVFLCAGKNLRLFCICFLIAAGFTIPSAFLIFRHSARNDLRQLQMNLEARLEKYHSALRNSRWALTRFAFLGDHVIDQNKKLLESVESILLPGFSYDSQSDYFFLRDLQGNTKLETIRGALVTRHSNLYIPKEKELLTATDRMIVSSCTINDQPHLCLLNTPDDRSYLSESLLYVSVGAIAPENLNMLAGTTDIFRNSIFEPGWPQFHFEKPIQSTLASKFSQYSEAGIGFWISISYPWKSFFLTITLATLFLATLSTLFIYSVKTYFQKRIRLALELEALKNQKDHFESISSFARGIIHDINSPLCALKFLSVGEKELERKAIFDLLIKRIRLMISELEEKVAGCAPKTLIFLPLNQILRSVVNEKQGEHGDTVKIELEFANENLNCVKGIYSDFCRMLSNIINNAVQAQSTQVKIRVSEDTAKNVIIAVTDNGSGVAAEFIETIFADGVSIGKKGGTGFGLFHAKNTVAQMNGKIRVDSEIGRGTTIRLIFPVVEAPMWMSLNLEVPRNGSLVIIDDEESVHSIIRKKLDSFGDKLNIAYFPHPNAVPLDLMKSNQNFFIVDSNFGNEHGAGIALCRKLPNKRTLLFTSDWNVEAVQHDADKLGIKLLGKEFMEGLEITIR